MEFQKCYVAKNGKVFTELADAKKSELESVLANFNPEDLAQHILDCSDEIVDILTTRPRSRPTARKINKKKEPKLEKNVNQGKDQKFHPPTEATPDR